MRIKKVFIFILFFTQVVFAGKYGGSFLELGIGARPLAMGGANVALSNDAYGFYWNPSGLAFLDNFQAATMYADLFNSLENQNYASAAMPIFGGVTVSAAWIRLSVDNIPRYPGTFLVNDTKEEADRRVQGTGQQLVFPSTGSFSNASDAFILSFAKYQQLILDLGWQYFEVPVDFAYGANVKIINEKLDDRTGSGVGIDLGFILRMGLNDVFNDNNFGDLSIGLNVQDILETQITWDTASKRKDNIERNFKYGFAYVQPLYFLNSQLTFAFDLNSRYTGSGHIGTEFLYNNLLAVRIGTNSGNFTTGAGVYVWRFRADYAYQGHDLGNTHRISLLFFL